MNLLLQATGLEAGYGESQVLQGIDLELYPSEVVTLLGRNGMGKSTTLRALFGLLPLKKGEIRFGGEPITRASPDRIARIGMALVPEGRRIFPNLTVRENLCAFAGNRSGSQEPWTLPQIWEMFPRLRERQASLGSRLSGGEQQMLAIGRALMTNPLLLVLDEATEGLAPLVREEIWRALARAKAAGLAILVVDKHIDRLARLADRHIVLEKGRVVWQGNSDALLGQRRLLERYLGV